MIGVGMLLIIAFAAFCLSDLLSGFLLVVGIFAGFLALYIFILKESEVGKEKYFKHNPPSKESIIINELRKTRKELIDDWKMDIRNSYCPEQIVLRWEWLDSDTTTKIKLTTAKDGISYVGTLSFSEEGDDDCFDQPRVTGFDSVIEGTDVKVKWPGATMKVVPLSSIQKNIANSFKNDKTVRRLIEEAYSECLENGKAIIELRDIELNFKDSRVTKEFAKALLTSGNFSSAHIQDNGHQIKVDIFDKDPI